MARKTLDLSHTLSPLNNELHDLLVELVGLKEQNSPLFDSAIEDFIIKYGGTPYTSLDELLQNSTINSSYSISHETAPLDDLLKDLISHQHHQKGSSST